MVNHNGSAADMDELDMAKDFVKLRGLARMEETGASSQAATRRYLRTAMLTEPPPTRLPFRNGSSVASI